MEKIGLSAILTIFFVGLSAVAFAQPQPQENMGHGRQSGSGTHLFCDRNRCVPC